jgi:hypothetical protein
MTELAKPWRITFGVLTVLGGTLALIWPKPTILVLAVIFGLHLIAGGITWLIAAFGTGDTAGGGRILFGLLGGLSILLGVLCLIAPLQTATVLALLLGLTWIAGGTLDVIRGFAGAGGWSVLFGLLSVALGIVVLAHPGSSLVALSRLAGVVLVIYGAVAAVRAVADS